MVIKWYKSLIIIVLIASGCKRKIAHIPECHAEETQKKGPIPTTIFVHGTLFPIINKLVHKYDIPEGLYSAEELKDALFHARVAQEMSKAAPDEFPFDSFYYFGWSGLLNFKARRQAAQELYDVIKDLPRPLTLIGHSHGANVILELALLAESCGDKNLVIDRAIFIAMPVQLATAHAVHLPIFKHIYSVYSIGDLIQLGDMQGLYCASPDYAPLFSERRLPDAPNVTQAQIVMCGKNPGHLDFVLRRFMRKFPDVIKLMEHKDTDCHIINIPKSGKPYWAKKVKQHARRYYVPCESD